MSLTVSTSIPRTGSRAPFLSVKVGGPKPPLPPLYLRPCILVKVPCECITENIARGCACGREPIKHEAQPSALFARDHAPSAIFAVMHERERYFNWFIVAEFLASAALNDSKWALRSKLPITMLGRSRGKTGEPL